MGERGWWRIVVGVMAGIVLQGCASGEAISPLERAVVAGQERVEDGRASGQAEADETPGVFLRLRHNPARCDVPAFEIRTHGRWVRAYVDGNPDVLARLQDFEQRAGVLSAASYGEVTGKFTGRRRTEAGVRYPVFVMSDFREAAIADGSSRAGAEPFQGFDQPRACL